MAKGGRATIEINFSKFEHSLQIALARVERGTKKATVAACEEIKAMSLAEVPRDTSALAASFYYRIIGRHRNFTAEIGYGGNGDPVNKKTGKRASQYMVKVHEDLQAHHPRGKAKFLEDPLRRYQSRFLPRVAENVNSELR